MLKRLLFSICFFCGSYYASSQSKTVIIKGQIIDSVKQTPLSYVTVVLKDAAGKPIKSTLTKDNGSFQLINFAPAAYRLNIAYIGYATKILPVKEASGTIDLGKIKLAEGTNQLKEVSIVAAKPIMKQEVDRMTYDVQADPDSKALNVLDMLRKVPLITVDATDNIRLKGGTDYKILINGRPSSLVARNPSDVFKAMPAANIEKIEVITTPPAKYDAEGLAGIINIITKRNADQGYNGSVSARYNSVYGQGANINGTIKQGKFGVVGYFGFNDQKKQTTTADLEQTYFSTQSKLSQNSATTFQYKGNYGSIELSYELDSLNLLTSEFNLYKGNNTNHFSRFTNQVTSADILAQSYNLDNNGYDNYFGFDGGLNYQLGFKKNKQQLLTASYKFNYSPDKSFNDILTTNRFAYDIPNYQQYNNSGSKEQTMQLDYVQPFKKVNLEAGAKAIFRSNFSDFYNDVYQSANNEYEIDPKQTNDFNYQQNVYSVYNSYQLKLTKWTAKAGLRLEHTTVNANFTSAGSVANQDYDNLIPSFSAQRSFKSSSLNFGFTNRISRPGIWQLNPFVDKSNPRFLSSGNPNLRPVVNHSFTLNYSSFKKVSVNGGLSYAFANNTIQNLSTLQSDTLTISTYQNIGKTKTFGSNININYPVTSNFNISINGQLSYIWLQGSYNNLLYSNKGFQGNGSGNVSYKFGKDWRAGISTYYNSPYISLQVKSFSLFSSSYNISKDLMNKKLTISIYASNPYKKYYTSTSYTNSPDFSQVSNIRSIYSFYTFNINYKFGQLKSSIKKNQHGISNDDVSAGKSN